MHSATKYLGGHSDLLAGALACARDDELWRGLAWMRREEGPCLGAVEAYLLLRGMRTLFARVPQQSATALELARRLAALPGVTVRYPGLPAHPQHELAVRQFSRGFGGLVALQTGGGAERALAVIRRLRVWTRATSLGGVESLAEHRATVEGPTSATPPDLIRLSVGLEHVDDLFDDLADAVRA
jgi:cystathionine gamma-synthase